MKRLGIAAMGILLMAVCACGASKIQKDLVKYWNEDMERIPELEKAVAEATSKISGENYVNDQVMRDGLVNDVIPKYQKLLDLIESIKPETEELQAVHSMYIEAAMTRMKAFKTTAQALEQQDRKIKAEADEYLKQAETMVTQYEKALTDFIDKHNVKIKKD